MLEMGKELRPHRWYWVKLKSGGWFPAYYDPKSSGGWTNCDTWENYDNVVEEWIIIPMPWMLDNTIAGRESEKIGK